MPSHIVCRSIGPNFALESSLSGCLVICGAVLVLHAGWLPGLQAADSGEYQEQTIPIDNEPVLSSFISILTAV